MNSDRVVVGVCANVRFFQLKSLDRVKAIFDTYVRSNEEVSYYNIFLCYRNTFLPHRSIILPYYNTHHIFSSVIV